MQFHPWSGPIYKPGQTTPCMVVVLVALQGLVQAFEDESPESSSGAKITYIWLE